MLIIVAGLIMGFTANAQLKKVFETKIETDPIFSMSMAGQNLIHAGSKIFEVIELTNGKALISKTYKEAGASFEKAFSTRINDAEELLIACDDQKTVSCFDLKSGIKLWENQSFTDLGSDKYISPLIISRDFVLVSDKKAKDNYTLTYLDCKTGKQKWTVEKQTEKAGTIDVILSASLISTTNYSKKTDITSMIFYNIETGKIEITSEMEGAPIFELLFEDYLFVHHRISDKKSFLTAFDLKNKKVMWKSGATNISPNLPMVMNTNTIRYYATIKAFEGKVLLISEGVEAFDIATGKSVYNIPFVPYYKWGVGHYTDAIFQPLVTDKGILLADATQGDIFIKYYDRNNGKLLWSSEKQKNKNASPNAFVLDNKAIIQFGGPCVFEVMNRSDIGKFLDPYALTAFDLQTGKVLWNIDSKNDFYTTLPVQDNFMIVGKKDLQTVDLNTGSILKSEKDPFDDSYFLTHVGLETTKYQKASIIDFEKRVVFRAKDNKLIMSRF